MKFVCAPLEGAYVIEVEPIFDERGFFARTWCREEFLAHGLNPNFTQCSISLNKRKGTLRGLHYQDKPYQEAKLVRCNSGAICDVIVDLSPRISKLCKVACCRIDRSESQNDLCT